MELVERAHIKSDVEYSPETHSNVDSMRKKIILIENIATESIQNKAQGQARLKINKCQCEELPTAGILTLRGRRSTQKAFEKGLDKAIF